jgi:hypothetical protein
MSAEIPASLKGVLTDEQIERISGGECTVAEIQVAINELKNSYDALVDFASYVIERVAN